VLWFRLSRQPGDHWQCAFVIGKGSLAALRERGLESLRDRLSRALGFPQQRMMELATWDELKLLTVQVNRLARWACDRLLCIGDAAHAMSPVGGVGINLAIQDAVAAANRLHGEFRAGGPSLAALAGVQRWRDSRRALPSASSCSCRATSCSACSVATGFSGASRRA